MSSTSMAATVRRGFSWTLIASLAGAVSQWLAIAILARFGDRNDLGYYALALAVSGPITMLARLNMRTVLATDVRNIYRFNDYFTARLVLSAVGMLAGLILALVMNAKPHAFALVTGVILFKSVESVADIMHGLLQAQGRFDVIAKSNVSRAVMLIVCTGMGVAYHCASIGVYATALSSLCILLCYDYRALQRHVTSWTLSSLRRVWELTRECLPTGGVMILATLSINVPVYAVQHFLGAEQVGAYAAVGYYFVAGGLIAAALSQSVAVPMAKLHVEDAESYRRELRGLVVQASWPVIPLFVFAILFGREFLSLVYGASFVHLQPVLSLVVVASCLSVPATFLGLALTIARRFWDELWLTLGSLIGVAVAAYALVAAYGLLGAAASLVVGVSLRIALSAFVLKYRSSFTRSLSRVQLPTSLESTP